MSRHEAPYSKFNLQGIEIEDLYIVESRAGVLSIQDCMDFLCLDYDTLEESDKLAIKIAWKRGRAQGVSKAAESLFDSMNRKGGGAVALDYLRQLSETFTVEPERSSSGGFSFNVVLPE